MQSRKISFKDRRCFAAFPDQPDANWPSYGTRPSRVWGSRTLWLAGSVSIPLFIKRKTRPIPDPPLVKHLTGYTLFDRTPPNS